ncbi:MAG: aminotransferase class III-fold pyridoxal phosphate-dependent enzyme [Comamonadaceae bacterium]|nr:MAG: aminotransferase class III-fold pyridoxal phosphate-dependent enzyme [Comamonadaceae bacterium]
MPFTANKPFKSHPRLLAGAKGMYYTSGDGRQILDGTSGLWCVNAGHGRPEIAAAIAEQASQMDYAPSFQLSHPAAFEAATAVASFMPEGIGEGQRVRLIGRERGYHGVGFGGISVGGIVTNRKTFSGALLPAVDHLPHTHNIEHNAFSRGQPAWGEHLADELERLVTLHDASTIAAVIVEPMAGSTGVLIPPQGYLQRLREITAKHGILLIFDEVITAFGRLGAATAAERFGVTPDIITLAKGVSNAAVPAGAVAVKREVHDAVVNATSAGIEFFHGYTYSAHPLACAAIVATLNIYRRDKLFERAAGMAQAFEDAAHSLKGAPHVVDVRNLGLVAGIELSPRAGAPGARAAEAFQKCFDQGLMVRYTGDIIAVSPPLIIEASQITELFERIRSVLNEIA